MYFFRIATIIACLGLGLLIILCAGLAWFIHAPHTPDLTWAEAQNKITKALTDKRIGKLTKITNVDREAGSLKDCCYKVTFTFIKNIEPGSKVLAHANLQFVNES